MVKIRTINGVPTPIEGGRGGAGALVVVAAAAVLAVGGGIGVAAGAGGTVATEAAVGSLPGNLAGDVADSLPGRNLTTRRAEACQRILKIDPR